jgi:hypothetical protein
MTDCAHVDSKQSAIRQLAEHALAVAVFFMTLSGIAMIFVATTSYFPRCRSTEHGPRIGHAILIAGCP